MQSVKYQQRQHEIADNAISNASTLYEAAKAMYNRLLNLTTEEFSRGGEKAEREALAEILTKIDGERRD